MSIKPLVSVIAIFLNEEKFIQEAIESVFAQTYGNWELLLVDDGSTDKSTEIARRCAEQHNGKVYFLEHAGHQNRGMSASRNLGISHARGEYISFLDADDIWLPHKLEQQVAIMGSHPDAGLVCGRTQWWYSWTGNSEDSQLDFLQKLNVPLNTLVKPPSLLILFLQDEWASLCDILVRREVVKTLGGYEESFRGMYEDQAFHAKLCLASPAFVSSECWYRYRQHTDTCTFQSHKSGQTDSVRHTFLSWLKNYLTEQKVKNSEVWRVVMREMLLYRYPLLDRVSKRTQLLKKIVKDLSKHILHQILPVFIQKRLQPYVHSYKYNPPLFKVHFGDLRRLTPISRDFGFDRGLPVDRYYIERFLSDRSLDIQGRVLEIGDNVYTRQFGNDYTTHSDVLHLVEGNPKATIVGDLTSADHIPSNAFDCIILAQTLHLIYDVRTALKTIYRILKPGGVLLATFPGISQRSRDEWGTNWCWSFTTVSARRLFEETFPAADMTFDAHGNVLAAIAFLQGLAAEELRQEELDHCDPNYEVLITVRAVKPKLTW